MTSVGQRSECLAEMWTTARRAVSRGMIFDDGSLCRGDIALKVGFLECYESGASNEVRGRGNDCEKGPILSDIRNNGERGMMFDDGSLCR